MSKRYVWEKWNAVISDYTYTGKTTSIRISFVDQSSSGSYGGVSYNATLYKNGATFTGGSYNAGDRFTLSDSGTVYYASAAGTARQVSGSQEVGDRYSFTDVNFTAFLYTSRTPIYAKGGTQDEYTTSNDRRAMPDDGESGGQWYVYKSYDYIDPKLVTPSGTVEEAGTGGTITYTITPSARNVYGGNISYILEISTDSETWTTQEKITGYSFSITITAEMVTSGLFVRVKSKDGWGFTSADYVYAGGHYIDFAYDRTTTKGVWDGIGNALRIAFGDENLSFEGRDAPQKIMDYYASTGATIDTAKEDLVNALIDKDISANTTESLTDLIAKIASIKTLAQSVTVITTNQTAQWICTSSNDYYGTTQNVWVCRGYATIPDDAIYGVAILKTSEGSVKTVGFIDASKNTMVSYGMESSSSRRIIGNFNSTTIYGSTRPSIAPNSYQSIVYVFK